MALNSRKNAEPVLQADVTGTATPAADAGGAAQMSPVTTWYETAPTRVRLHQASSALRPMDLIEVVRLGLLVFNGAGLGLLALYPTERDVDDYEDWIDYLDSEYRERRDKDGRPRT